MNHASRSIFAFDQFVLAPEEQLLLRDGQPVALTPKTFGLLVVLVRNSGHLVGKDELLQQVWPDTFGEEVNLSVNISALRKALGDDQGVTRFIETVPKRGYRFVAPVKLIGDETREIVLKRRLTASIVTEVDESIRPQGFRDNSRPMHETDTAAASFSSVPSHSRVEQLRRHRVTLAAGVVLVIAFAAMILWRTYQEIGKYDEALTEFKQVEDAFPGWVISIAAIGFVNGRTGRRAEAEKLLIGLGELSKRKFVTSYGVALVYAGRGQKEQAFAWLNKAFDERSHWLVWLKLDPRWDALRSDARFVQLVERMHFPG